MAFFLFCWYSVIIFLVFMYSVCIVNIFRAFPPFFGFIVKLWYFTLLHFKWIPFPLDPPGGCHVPIVSEVESVSALFCFSRSCLNILCFCYSLYFLSFSFFPEDWAVNWNWLYLFDNLIGGMEVNKLAFCMEHIGILLDYHFCPMDSHENI